MVEHRIYIQIFQDSLDNATCVSLKSIRAAESSITTRHQTQKTVWCICFICSNNTTSSWNSINNGRSHLSWRRAPLNNQKGQFLHRVDFSWLTDDSFCQIPNVCSRSVGSLDHSNHHQRKWLKTQQLVWYTDFPPTDIWYWLYLRYRDNFCDIDIFVWNCHRRLWKSIPSV